jgi:Family of unknown function (DUF5985)
MYQLITGMLTVLSLVAALFFTMSWRRSGDRFFLIFALAFTLLGIERLILGILNLPESPLLSIYVVRLIAFLLIIIAIVDKNRTSLRR